MIKPLRRLDADELSRSLDYLRPIDLLAEELIGPAAGGDARPQRRDRGSLTPLYAGASTGPRISDPVLLEDQRTGARYILSAAGLRACRAAALMGLAARTLLAPGAVSAAVLGGGPAAQPQLMVIARHLRGVSRLAVYSGADGAESPIRPMVLDQIDLAGIGLSMMSTVDKAVRSANLVVSTGTPPAGLDVRALTKGAVLVNATNQDVPDALVDSVDQVYIDNAGLIKDNPHRYFIKMRRVVADLGQVLTGAHPGRTHRNHILLVELLSAKVLDVRLATLLSRVADERGLGTQLFT